MPDDLHLSIIRATATDLPAALLLLAEYYEAVGVQKRDTPAGLLDILTGSAAALWIASLATGAGSGLAGCVLLRPLSAIPAAAECKRLYVRPGARGQGVAAALLDVLEAFAREAGYRSLYLDSKDDLTAALCLYTRRGYVACPRYHDDPQPTIFLRKDLL